MTLFGIAAGGALAVGFFATVVLANPAMLPNHPEYPAGGEFANDPTRPEERPLCGNQQAARTGILPKISKRS